MAATAVTAVPLSSEGRDGSSDDDKLAAAASTVPPAPVPTTTAVDSSISYDAPVPATPAEVSASTHSAKRSTIGGSCTYVYTSND